MRIFGWLCIIVAVLIAAGTVLYVREENRVRPLAFEQARAKACGSNDLCRAYFLLNATRAGAWPPKPANPWPGFVVAAAIAAFGILILAVRPVKAKDDELGQRIPCPYCAEDIKPEAIVCPHCRSDLQKPEAQRAIRRKLLQAIEEDDSRR